MVSFGMLLHVPFNHLPPPPAPPRSTPTPMLVNVCLNHSAPLFVSPPFKYVNSNYQPSAHLPPPPPTPPKFFLETGPGCCSLTLRLGGGGGRGGVRTVVVPPRRRCREAPASNNLGERRAGQPVPPGRDNTRPAAEVSRHSHFETNWQLIAKHCLR